MFKEGFDTKYLKPEYIKKEASSSLDDDDVPEVHIYSSNNNDQPRNKFESEGMSEDPLHEKH